MRQEPLSYLVIPAYNPPESFIEMITELRGIASWIIVIINDGSDQKHQYVFNKIEKSEQLYILENETNKGKGYSLKKGIHFVLEKNTNHVCIITADADGQHFTEDILKFYNVLNSNKDFFYLGDRHFPKNTPYSSSLGNILSSKVFKYLFKSTLQDTQCGLRGFSRKVGEELLTLTENKYDFETASLLLLMSKKYKIKSIPIKSIYTNNNKGSHFDSIKDSYLIMRVFFKSFFFKFNWRKFFNNFYPLLPLYNKLFIFRKKLDLDTIFTNFYNENHWASKESRSGSGSTLIETNYIRKELPNILITYNIKTMLDIPCGDFHWMNTLDLKGIKYTGADIVEQLIKANQSKYGSDNFIKLDITQDKLSRVDLVFCRDLFVHFSYENILLALKNIQKSESTYLLMTTFPKCHKNTNIKNGLWRKIDFTKKPFNFPPPIFYLNEKYHEMPIYEDKELGMWKISDLSIEQSFF